MKTYKFKMYSNHGNRELHKTIESFAAVYNHRIALHRRYYALFSKGIHKYRLNTHITKLKPTKLTNGIRQARLVQLAAQLMITLNSVIGIGSVQAATHSWIEIATLRLISTG